MLRPCWTAFLNSLRGIPVLSVHEGHNSIFGVVI
ncbi:hypothetical protein NSND_62832 [Nitrospira sp. ND1]|nr:hypothetical protein NSND_62832 [Nitrospira sp. ND1]